MSGKKEERCYPCNAPMRKFEAAPGEKLPDDQRTRDHLPPENLFSPIQRVLAIKL
jgi:hypothetical protein